MDTNNKEDDMIESAQDKHIRELEAALAATDKLLADVQNRLAKIEYHIYQEDNRKPRVTEFKWICPDNEQTSDLKKQIHQLSYDRDTLAKRLADICNIAKKDT